MYLPDIHVVVISWVGMGDRARRIAAAVEGHVAALTVVYSNPAEPAETGPGEWVRVPADQFFGRKFEMTLAHHDAGHLLMIHADTDCDDWPGLVAACRNAFARHPALGVWSPDFTHTGWPTADVAISPIADTTLVNVVQTDTIIMGLAPAVTDRLKRLDYSGNNLGWGIGWAAVACAYTQGLMVLRDTGLMVEHAKSRSYNSDQAFTQMLAFLRQLTPAERIQIVLLREHYRQALEKRQMGRLHRLYRRLRPAHVERSWQLA